MKENIEETELFTYVSKYKNNLPQEILSIDKKYLNRHTNRLLFSAKLVDEIAGGRKLKVLDVGIHAGYLAYLLKSRGHEVYGVDKDSPYLLFWGKRFASEHIEFSVCDLVRENLPFKDEEFDVVTFLEVIEHLPVLPNLVLQELKRVLKKGGFLILSTPNPLSFRSRVKILLGRWPYSLTGYHFREYDIDELTFLIKKVGLDITRIEYRTFDFLHMSLLHRILSSVRRVGNKIFPRLRDYIVLIACKGL